MKKFIVYLMPIVLMLLDLNILQAQTTNINQGLELGVSYQYGIFVKAEGLKIKGENIVTSSKTHANVFGLRGAFLFKNGFIITGQLSKSYVLCTLIMDKDFIDYSESYMFSKFPNSYSEPERIVPYSRIEYYTFDLNTGYLFNLSNKSNLVLSGGVSLIHFQPFIDYEENGLYDTTEKYSRVYLISGTFTNSRYEKGESNYRSVDMGFNIGLEYRYRLLKDFDIFMGFNYHYLHRKVHNIYYETTSFIPLKYSGKLTLPIRNVGISVGFVYRFSKMNISD